MPKLPNINNFHSKIVSGDQESTESHKKTTKIDTVSVRKCGKRLLNQPRIFKSVPRRSKGIKRSVVFSTTTRLEPQP